MEDAGFILGSYVLTFAVVGLLAGWVVRGGRPAARRDSRRREALDLTSGMADSIDTAHRRPTSRRGDAASASGSRSSCSGSCSSPGGVIVTQFLTSAIDYYCNVDEIGVRDGCDADRRIRVQGTVDEGSVTKVGNATVFTISFNGVDDAGQYDGEPGGIFKECIPVVRARRHRER